MSVLTPLQLALSGNEITDAVRALRVQGDGRLNDSSFGIWPAATNFLLNGGFETNIVGWGPTGTGVTIARSTAKSKFGTASLLWHSNGGSNDSASSSIAGVSAGQTITWSAWVNPDVTISLNLQTNELGASGFLRFSEAAAVTCPAGVWTRLTHTLTLGASTTNMENYVTTNGVQPVTDTYIDGVQIETGPVATPYIHTDGATASRGGARVQVAAASVLNETQGWAAFRFRAGWSNSNEPQGGSGFPAIMAWQASGANRFLLFYVEGSNAIYFSRDTVSVDSADTFVLKTVALGEIITVVAAWTATQVKLSINGAAFVVASNTNIPSLLGTAPLFDIGQAGGGGQIDSDFFWGLFGTGAPDNYIASLFPSIPDNAGTGVLSDFATAHPLLSTTAIVPFDSATYYRIDADPAPAPAIPTPPAGTPTTSLTPWNLVVTDMGGRNRAFPTDWDTLKVTRRLGDYNDGQIQLDIYDKNASEILIGQRAIKFYRGQVLRLYGTVWEPLERTHPDGITINVRDPYALYAWRRNRALKTYTAQDAGQIVSDRIAIQNGFQDTHLRIGAIAASVNRTITVNPGKREDEFIEDLSGMSQGFFFLVNPVDGAGSTFAELVVLYPNAGVTREEVRFEYGPDTRDNMDKIKIIQNLPRTREVAASSAASGGRIASISEDTAAQVIYNIIEDEIAVSDITDTTILTAFAAAEIRSAPPEQYELTPNINSPLLFQDFDVGDFCRLRVKDGSDDLYTWVRITEATLNVDKDGVETLEKMVVESLVGGKPYTRPEDLYRQVIDDVRARQEMLERKVENISASTSSPSSSGGGSLPGFDPTYIPPAPISYTPPPPPSPDIPPTVSGVNAYPTSTRSGTVEFDIDPGTSLTGVSIAALNGATLVRLIDGGTTSSPRHYAIDISPLVKNTAYTVQVTANNASGQSQGSGAFTTFAADIS